MLLIICANIIRLHRIIVTIIHRPWSLWRMHNRSISKYWRLGVFLSRSKFDCMLSLLLFLIILIILRIILSILSCSKSCFRPEHLFKILFLDEILDVVNWFSQLTVDELKLFNSISVEIETIFYFPNGLSYVYWTTYFCSIYYSCLLNSSLRNS